MFQIATVLLLVASTAFATSFTRCSDIPPPLSLDVVGCTTEPCNFYRGETNVGNIKFTAVKTNELTVHLRATSNGVTADYPLPEENACLSLTGASCPLAGGETPTFKLSVPIAANYPKVSTLLELHLHGDNDKEVACAKLRAQIVDRSEFIAPSRV